MPLFSQYLSALGPVAASALAQPSPELISRLSQGVDPSVAPLGAPTTGGIPATDDADTIVVTGTRIQNGDQRLRLKPITPVPPPGGGNGGGNGTVEHPVLGDNTPDNILHPLFATNGVLFPYTPTIQFNQDVDWKSIEVTHSNYETAAYSRTPAVSLTVNAKFTAQTHAEGRYLLAVLHFFRVVSKMYFGKRHADSDLAGVPPPVLLLKGYGDYMFNDLRVIVKNHTYTIDDTVNLVQVRTGPGSIITLPSILNFSCTLQVVQSAKAQKDNFDLDSFRSGRLMRTGGGWI